MNVKMNARYYLLMPSITFLVNPVCCVTRSFTNVYDSEYFSEKAYY